MPSAARALAFINAAHFADHFMMLIYATAVIGIAPELGLTYGTGIALSTGLFACFGLLSLPAGWLADRWSRRHMLALFWLGGGASLVLTGFVTAAWQLAAALTLVGVFAAIYHPVGTAMLVSVAGASGRAFGLNGVFGNLGVAAAPLLTAFLLDTLGWRWAFFVPGAIMMAVGCAYVFAVQSQSGNAARTPEARTKPAGGLDLRFIAIVLGVTVFSGGFTFNTVTIALPKFVVEELPGYETALAYAAVIATIIYLAGAAMQLIVGRIVDRAPLGLIFLALALLQLSGFAGMALLSGPAALGAAALALSAVYGQVIVNDLILARSVADSWRSRAYALRFALGFAAASAVAPIIAILHRPETGYAPVFLVMTGFAFMIAASAAVFAVAAARAPALQPAR